MNVAVSFNNIYDDPEQMIKLLESEIRVVMEMDHPNIVKFYQCVYDNEKVNIVISKNTDGTMNVVKEERPAPPKHLEEIARAAIEDLESGKVGADAEGGT